MKTIQNLLMLVTCGLMMLAVAVNRDGRVFGYEPGQNQSGQEMIAGRFAGGTLIVNTSELGSEYVGYGGRTPVEIYIVDGRIDSIVALPNAETPSFFNGVKESVLPVYKGLTVSDALAKHVDGISGATFSSDAVIGNINSGLRYAADSGLPSDAETGRAISAGYVASLLVVLSAAVFPLFVRSGIYRWLQLSVNIVVLGFWTGTFLDYSRIVGFFSNGLDLWKSAIVAVMLAVAFIYPLFGRKSHYCMWVCPLGSLQEMAGKCRKRKWQLSRRVIKGLDIVRQLLWAVLMLAMWSGVWFSWMDYELFAAFLFDRAPYVLTVVAVAVVILSVFVNRPYCRFICPTGSLFKISQN